MRKIALLLVAVVAVIASCSSIDCPLNNTVYTKYRLAGNVTMLDDTLTISVKRTSGADTVLLNKALRVDSFSIPLSYSHESDEYYFDIRPDGGVRTIDTVTITKTNEPHFESVDCPATMFHTLQQVKCTHHRIDSVVINQNKVSYDAQKPHLLIYFKSLGS